LRLPADDVHLYSPQRIVVESAMGEFLDVELAAQLTIDARQYVEIERSRDALGIVVGRFEHRAVFLQIGAEQESVAVVEHVVNGT